jgi:hypothetical protein
MMVIRTQPAPPVVPVARPLHTPQQPQQRWRRWWHGAVARRCGSHKLLFHQLNNINKIKSTKSSWSLGLLRCHGGDDDDLAGGPAGLEVPYCHTERVPRTITTWPFLFFCLLPLSLSVFLISLFSCLCLSPVHLYFPALQECDRMI